MARQGIAASSRMSIMKCSMINNHLGSGCCWDYVLLMVLMFENSNRWLQCVDVGFIFDKVKRFPIRTKVIAKNES